MPCCLEDSNSQLMAEPTPARARQISNGMGLLQKPVPRLADIMMMKPSVHMSFGPLLRCEQFALDHRALHSL